MPAFPEGWVVKSSGESWIMTVFPIISSIENLFVKKAENESPFAEKSGGISPAW